MKKYTVVGAIALTASLAVAGAINIKQVNKVIKTVVESAVTPTIHKIEMKIDERSNLDSVEKLKVGATLSAVAKESAWSKKSTSVDVKADLKTVNHDPASTKLALAASLGSKTEAVPLYAYAAKSYLESLQDNEGPQDENDLALIALLQEATQTTKLDQIPAQLEKLIAIIKAEIAENVDDGDEEWDELMNSLTVDTKVQFFKTTEVILKTNKAVGLDFFESTIVISDVSLKVSETGLTFGITIAGTDDTVHVAELLEGVKSSLSLIEKSDADTLASLKDMVSGYVDIAETIVKGDLD